MYLTLLLSGKQIIKYRICSCANVSLSSDFEELPVARPSPPNLEVIWVICVTATNRFEKRTLLVEIQLGSSFAIFT
jgi:hypothetical protein